MVELSPPPLPPFVDRSSGSLFLLGPSRQSLLELQNSRFSLEVLVPLPCFHAGRSPSSREKSRARGKEIGGGPRANEGRNTHDFRLNKSIGEGTSSSEWRWLGFDALYRVRGGREGRRKLKLSSRMRVVEERTQKSPREEKGTSTFVFILRFVGRVCILLSNFPFGIYISPKVLAET